MNLKKRIVSALLGGRVDRVPVWAPVVAVTTEMMERADAFWPRAHCDPEGMARLASMPWRLAGLPSTTVPFCLTLEAEALGCELDWGAVNRTPSVKKHPYTHPDEFTPPENLLERGRIPVVLKALELLKEQLGEEIPINAKATGPFTIAGLIFGVGSFVSWIKTDPELVHAAMESTAAVTRELAQAFSEHGADIVVVSDPTSSGDLISGEYYREFVLSYHRKVSEMSVPTVLHVCGYTQELLPHIRRSGFDGYSFEEKVSVVEAKLALGDDISLIGNVAPVSTLLEGSPEKVEAEALSCLRQGVDLLSSGCTLSPATPLENIKALVSAGESYQPPREPDEILKEIARGIAFGVRT
jgi:methylthiol:coenzyme M methyltransferase